MPIYFGPFLRREFGWPGGAVTLKTDIIVEKTSRLTLRKPDKGVGSSNPHPCSRIGTLIVLTHLSWLAKSRNI